MYTSFTDWEHGLAHHGIKGMHWYQRRFQNEDGSLTEAGRKRYGYGFNREKDARKLTPQENLKDWTYLKDHGFGSNPKFMRAYNKIKKQAEKDSFKQMKSTFKKSDNWIKDGRKFISEEAQKKYDEAYERFNDADKKHNDYEKSLFNRYLKTGKPLSDKEQKRAEAKDMKLLSERDKAFYDMQETSRDEAKRILGKYANKKLEFSDQYHTAEKFVNAVMNASYVEKYDEVWRNKNLSKRQREFEKQYRDASEKFNSTFKNTSRYDRESEPARNKAREEVHNAFDKFYNSLTDDQKKRYHDRFLY